MLWTTCSYGLLHGGLIGIELQQRMLLEDLGNLRGPSQLFCKDVSQSCTLLIEVRRALLTICWHMWPASLSLRYTTAVLCHTWPIYIYAPLLTGSTIRAFAMSVRACGHTVLVQGQFLGACLLQLPALVARATSLSREYHICNDYTGLDEAHIYKREQRFPGAKHPIPCSIALNGCTYVTVLITSYLTHGEERPSVSKCTLLVPIYPVAKALDGKPSRAVPPQILS